jgi:hypothetical protein
MKFQISKLVPKPAQNSKRQELLWQPRQKAFLQKEWILPSPFLTVLATLLVLFFAVTNTVLSQVP